jgi:hypothetical protein
LIQLAQSGLFESIVFLNLNQFVREKYMKPNRLIDVDGVTGFVNNNQPSMTEFKTASNRVKPGGKLEMRWSRTNGGVQMFWVERK